MLQHELWHRTNLLPYGDRTADAEGRCPCDPRPIVGLYRNSSKQLRCAVCIGLNQTYTNSKLEGKGSKTRLGPGHYILVEPRSIQYWGTYLLTERNPAIQLHRESGFETMREVFRDLIVRPPPPPWLFYAFAGDNRAETLRVTEDNRRPRFGGEFELFRKPLVSVDRATVLAMLDCGLTLREWRAYHREFEINQSYKVRSELAEKHPKLLQLRFVPLVDSPEHRALSFIV